MTTGRRSAFVIYDEQAYKEVWSHLLETNQDMSHYIWSLIMQDLSKIRATKEVSDRNAKISSFAVITPPPRLIEDFDHVLRPYIINHANIDELQLVRDNGYQMHIMAKYVLSALQYKLIKPEDRKILKTSYEQAYNSLSWLGHTHGFSFIKEGDLR